MEPCDDILVPGCILRSGFSRPLYLEHMSSRQTTQSWWEKSQIALVLTVLKQTYVSEENYWDALVITQTGLVGWSCPSMDELIFFP